MNEIDKNKAFEKLTPTKRYVAETLLNNLNTVDGLWRQGWINTGVPVSGITGKKYHGVNNMSLTLVAMARGYGDNRWITYKQMEEKGWKFKTDEEGNSLGKGAGVAIEFFELRDKETQKPFDRKTLDGMTASERQEYMDNNVYPVRKYYRVFNADVIDGIPAKEKREIDPNGINERAEKLLDFWDKNESHIIYGGNQAYYRLSADEIHIPEKQMFLDMNEFYSTVLHEMGHSTGHESRLNRDLSGKFGTEDYAIEELRAEIASLFLEQDLEIQVSEKHIENNSRYIKSWHDRISEDPNVLFTAIADADKMSKYIIAKEKEHAKDNNTEYYAIVQEQTPDGETGYRLYGVMPYGQVSSIIGFTFRTLEALNKEFDCYKSAPAYRDKVFQEVTYDELEKLSIKAYEREEKQAEKEGREIYAPPSVIAAMSVAAVASKPINMAERGIETLTLMTDRDVVEQASKTKNGEKFIQLYNGISVLGSEEKDERSLMTRLAMFCEDDQEQLLRVFKSSGQYHDEKPDSFYEKMAKESMQFIEQLKRGEETKAPLNTGKVRFGINAKT